MPGEVTNFDSLLTRCRALGISFLIAEQVPSEISRTAKVANHLRAAFCTSGTELRTTIEILGIQDPREIDKLKSLAKGECIVILTGDRCPQPLLVRIPMLQIDRSNLTREERELYLDQSLRDLQNKFLPRYTGFVEAQQETIRRERDPNRLSYHAWKVFTRIADNPTETIEERSLALNLNTAEEGTARKESMNKGYIEASGTMGWGIKLFYLTAKGQAFAKEHNVPIRKFKSGVVHEAQLTRVKAGIQNAFPSFQWIDSAKVTGNIQPDAYGLFPNGRTLCLQINCQNKVKYEVEKLSQLCAMNHVDQILMVAPTKKIITAFHKEIKKTWPENVSQRFILLSATECLASDFDWITLLSNAADQEE